MWKLVERAVTVVPATRYAVAVAGSLAAFSLVVGAFQGAAGTFAAAVGLLILMVFMVIFAALAAIARARLRPIALALAWCFLALFVGSALATTTSLFFDKPKPFRVLANEVRSAFGSTGAKRELQQDAQFEQQRTEAIKESDIAAAAFRETLRAVHSERSESTVRDEGGPPKKIMIPIGRGLYKTISYWAGGRRSHEEFCQPLVEPVEGMTVIGAEDKRSYDTRNFLRDPSPNPRGCAPAGHCDSHNEFCQTFYRAPGCYISNDWLAWYRKQRADAGLPERVEDICNAV